MLSTMLRPRTKLISEPFGTLIMGNAKHTPAIAKSCPTCGSPAMLRTRPFCSKRCADIDLGRWFQGAYAAPVVDAADDSIIDAELVVSGKMRKPDPGEGHD